MGVGRVGASDRTWLNIVKAKDSGRSLITIFMIDGAIVTLVMPTVTSSAIVTSGY